MTYRLNGKLVGMWSGSPVQASAGLGEYTEFNTGPVGKEIVARNGSVAKSDLQAYAKVGGAAGGAALCTAYGGAAVAPLCAQAGAAIAEVLVGHIGTPATAGNAYTLVDTWNDTTRPIAEAAGEAALKIRTYLAMRDQAIDDVAQGTDEGRAWADKVLTSMGVPPAPVRSQWAPRQDLYDAYKAHAVWAQKPIGPPPSWHGDLAAKYQGVDMGSRSGYPWGYESPSPKSVAKQIGMSTEDFLTLLWYPTGPMASPQEPINFAMVGAWEVASRPLGFGQPTGFHGQPSVSLPCGNHMLEVTKSPPKSQVAGTEYQFTGGLSPSQEATKLLFALQEAKPKLQEELNKNIIMKGLIAIARVKKAEAEKARRRKILLVGAVAAAGVGYVAWKKMK